MSSHPYDRPRGGPSLGAIALLLLLHAALVLGGMYFLLTAFGERLDSELDSQVRRVERNLDRDFETVRRDIRRQLDERLPSPAAVP